MEARKGLSGPRFRYARGSYKANCRDFLFSRLGGGLSIYIIYKFSQESKATMVFWKQKFTKGVRPYIVVGETQKSEKSLSCFPEAVVQWASWSLQVNLKSLIFAAAGVGPYSGADGKSVKSCYFCTATSFGPQ